MASDASRNMEDLGVLEDDLEAYEVVTGMPSAPSPGSAADHIHALNTVHERSDLTVVTSAELASMLSSTALGGETDGANLFSTPASPSYASAVHSAYSTAPTTASLLSSTSASATAALYGQTRKIKQPKASKLKKGREPKRSRLAAESPPFHSVDYWMQFDHDEQPPPAPLAEEPEATEQFRGRAPPAQQLSRRSTVMSGYSTSGTLASGALGDDDGVDDSALEHALSDEDEVYSSTMSLADQSISFKPPSSRKRPHSPPRGWEGPRPMGPLESLFGLGSSTLSPAEKNRLLAVAMPPGFIPAGTQASWAAMNPVAAMAQRRQLGSASLALNAAVPPGMAAQSGIPEQPPAPAQAAAKPGDKGKAKAGDRAAHNDIERKYRTNLKDRIAELRDVLPSLQMIQESPGDDSDGDGPRVRGPRVSKGTVLTMATEYIKHLERANKNLVNEQKDLVDRLQAYEQLASSSLQQSYQPGPSYDPRGAFQ